MNNSVYTRIVTFLKEAICAPSSQWFGETASKYFGRDFDYQRIHRCLPSDCNERHKTNLLTAYFLVYIITSNYPDEIWGQAAYDSEVIRYKDIQRKYLTESTSVGILKSLVAKAENSLRFVEYGLRGFHTNKLLSKSAINDVGVAELLTDAVLLKNKNAVTNYTPEKWLRLFVAKAEQYNDCTSKGYMSSKKWFACWATRQGANHDRCDDISGVCKIDKDAWIAYVADGVGSCGASNIGAKLAGESFSDVMRSAYNKYKNAPHNLLYYLQTAFARDAYKLWQKRVKKHGEQDISQYSTTFLFTFHCRTFIACGMIGDGIFVIEKNGVSEKSKGYQVITDGFSDVVQHTVLNVNTLKIEPCKMQLVFYKPSEVSGIWMSSDGAVGITFEAINNVLLADRSSYTNLSSVFDDMRNRTKEDVYNRVLDLTLKFSRSNTSQGGRGDDCSIVFIKATN